MMSGISVVICTYNRADYLRQAIYHCANQTLPRDKYEIIIIDNASTDDTVKVVEEVKKQLPEIIYHYEKHLGISWARNMGAWIAKYPYILYVDDDARPFPETLEAVLTAFEKSDPKPAVVGGRVWLDWQGAKPAWVPDRYLSLFTHLDYGENSHYLEDWQHLVGANMAFDRAILLELGAFPVNLGRKGKSLRSGEETSLLNSIRQNNLPIFYESKSIAWHVVPAERRQFKWLFRRFFWDGASQVSMHIDQDCSVWERLHLVLFEFKQVLKYLLYSAHALLFRRKEKEKQIVNIMCVSQRLGRARSRMRQVINHMLKKPLDE